MEIFASFRLTVLLISSAILVKSILEDNFGDTNFVVRDKRSYNFSSKQLPLPADIEADVVRSLDATHHNYSKKSGRSVDLKCETMVTRKIFRKFPRAAYRWIHNDMPLKIEADRMVYQMGTLLIQGLRSTDTGVFVCQVEYVTGQVRSVAIFSLLVTSSKGHVVHVKESRMLKLQCNSAALGHLFEGSTKMWKRNKNVVVKDLNARLRTADEFPNANKNMSGNWTCVVRHPLTGRYWTTAYYTVVVDPPPTQFQRAVSTIKDHMVYFIVLGIGLALFGIVICVAVIRQAERKKKREQEEFESLTQRLVQQREVDSGREYSADETYSEFSDEETLETVQSRQQSKMLVIK